jgi:N-acetylglucosamine-6-sulfatase
LLSGIFNHNLKARSYATSGGGVSADGMCMRMNTSRTLNPGFWQNSFVKRLHDKHGYATGMFGKVLNDMEDYGCDMKRRLDSVDRMFVMCIHSFYNESWVDQGAIDSPRGLALNRTGDRPEEYTTSLIGNTTLRWIKSIVEEGRSGGSSGRSGSSGSTATHRPFFAWIGPHAPHLPSTPAHWYLDNPVGDQACVQQPNYGKLGKDKHAFYPTEPVISAQNARAIQAEYAKRMRSMLSVDDIIKVQSINR